VQGPSIPPITFLWISAWPNSTSPPLSIDLPFVSPQSRFPFFHSLLTEILPFLVRPPLLFFFPGEVLVLPPNTGFCIFPARSLTSGTNTWKHGSTPIYLYFVTQQVVLPFFSDFFPPSLRGKQTDSLFYFPLVPALGVMSTWSLGSWLGGNPLFFYKAPPPPPLNALPVPPPRFQ